MDPVILVPGTWGRDATWWLPVAPFAAYLRGEGLSVLGTDDGDPYTWTTDLDGLGFHSDDVDWDEAGKALLWYAHLKHPQKAVSVVAHSHGGQVVAKAARHGLILSSVVTVATPIRKSLEPDYEALRVNSERWTHLYTDEAFWSGWQRRGQFEWSWTGFKRWVLPIKEMSYAHANLHEPNSSHTGLIDAGLWRRRGWARLLYPEPKET